MPTGEEILQAYRNRNQATPQPRQPTGEQILEAYRNRNREPQRAWPVRLAASVAEPVMRTGLGLRKTVMPYLPESVQESEAPLTEKLEAIHGKLQETAGEGALPTVGRVGGEILTFAGPGGLGAAGATRALPRALATQGTRGARLSRAAAVAGGEAAGIGALSAARAEPGERLSEAATGAAGTLVGHGVGQLAGRALRGVRRSPEADQLIREGVELTPGQAAAGEGMTAAEEFMRVVPFVNAPTARLQQQALAQLNKLELQRAVRPLRGVEITAPGHVGFQQAGQAYRDAYDRFWQGVIDSSDGVNKVRGAVMSALNKVDVEGARQLSGQAREEMLRFIDNQADAILRQKPTGPKMQTFMQNVRDYGESLWDRNDYASARFMGEVLDSLKISGMGKEAADRLKDLNEGYAELSVLRRAAASPGAVRRKGIFTPDEYSAAMRGEGSRARLAEGQALLQPRADVAQATIGKMTGEPSKTARLGQYLTSLAAGGAYATGVPPYLLASGGAGRGLVGPRTRRLMTGGYESEELANELSQWLGRIGAGVASQY